MQRLCTAISAGGKLISNHAGYDYTKHIDQSNHTLFNGVQRFRRSVNGQNTRDLSYADHACNSCNAVNARDAINALPLR